MRILTELEMLQRCRRDRHELLKFILTRNDILSTVILQPGSVSLDDVDLHNVSVDYVILCAKEGRALDLSEAVTKYYDDLKYPPMTGDNLGKAYLLVSDPRQSGPPPERKPPIAVAKPVSRPQSDQFSFGEDNDGCDDDDEDNDSNMYLKSPRQLNCIDDLVLLLPPFKSGLSSDDLRETAYEVLLASVGTSGGLVFSNKDIKKEKRSKFMRKLTSSKSLKNMPQEQRDPGLSGLLNTLRVQLEISEAMDVRTREGLLSGAGGRVSRSMDSILVPLELLCNIPQSKFTDKRSYNRWQKRQLKILEEGLLNNPPIGLKLPEKLESEFRTNLINIEESQDLLSSLGSYKCAEALRALRRVTFESMGGKERIDKSGEFRHWADGYPLNVQLYEKLLCSVFDMLDEGRLLEETGEILEILKLSWRILGIRQCVHDVCYAWVLFRQFVLTGEPSLLQHSIEQFKKIVSTGKNMNQEKIYMKSLNSVIENAEGHQTISFLESFLYPIKKWCDKKLRDYHCLCHQESSNINGIVTIALLTTKLIAEDHDVDMLGSASSNARMAVDAKQIEDYIISSINSSYERALEVANTKAVMKKEHPLKVLAEEVKRIAQRESSLFSPVFSHWNPQCYAIAASLLHSLYGRELKPFLDGVTYLSEDVVSILPVASVLEQYLLELVYFADDEDEVNGCYKQGISPYQVEAISGPLITQWITFQHGKLVEWVERAVQQEKWDPLSTYLRHGTSIVEVYRIIEEAVEQLFGFDVPSSFQQMKLLCAGFDNALQIFCQSVVNQIVNKNTFIPPIPFLTRYKKDTTMDAFTRKKCVDPESIDRSQSNQMIELSTPKLCVRLNSLHYLLTQIDILEDNIWSHWSKTRQGKHKVSDNARNNASLEKTDGFSSVFDGTREVVSEAIDNLCEFTGIKIIFFDMKETFLEGLYKFGVSHSRIENIINDLDCELRHVCDVIVDSLRDQVVTALLQASLDAYVRVLLDGGPTRYFSQNDIIMLKEDFQLFKDFFIAGGDGLSCDVVENVLEPVKQIINLYAVETQILIEDLMHASENEEVIPNSKRYGRKSPKEQYTLLRVLCHRSDRVASKFLKRHYRLPKSTGYESTPNKESPFSPFSGGSMSDLLKKSSSFRWSEDSQRSFKLIKQKIQDATLEFKQGGW